MRMIFGLVLILGVALAGFAVKMAQGYISQTETALTQERAFRQAVGDLVEVYVVNKPVKYGDVLKPEDVQKIYWQKSFLPKGAFSKETDLFPETTDKPRFVIRPMEAYEPILAVKVTKPGQPAGLTGTLSDGMRAFAIKVDTVSGVSGFVYPGNFVDVYWTGSVGNRDITKLIESSVNVIAVDQTADGAATGGALVAQTVTVQVTPEQVARLAQAQATGRLALSLVGNTASTIDGRVEVNSDSLLGIEREKVVRVEAERVCTVRTRKGGEVVDIPIPCTN
ncbi:Flp pilus assembly protein CpaB [Rhodobacteraceae bacterium HSP-20]|uniref:Flp pilus assembly protein CpaB n=1 Tax=Paragemmobacter amnigenus TaxID=2852097 RepID=A0ABS6J8N9_9RHOB|nr:Flp pilus assembly protein CpaB [Rhodobacter amnigenus]MBU9699239.1 Flp pilus assembly protein CpaB [Rhodobacter amnigenus]MBV4390466.1 Flp pilus assembly protein CpaB [Rhodobacter amnigenus]